MTTFSQDKSAAAELSLFFLLPATAQLKHQTAQFQAGALAENEDWLLGQYLGCVDWHCAEVPDVRLEKDDGARIGAEHQRPASPRAALASAPTASTPLPPLGSARLPAMAWTCSPSTSTLGLGSPHRFVKELICASSQIFSPVWPADLSLVLPFLRSPRFSALHRFLMYNVREHGIIINHHPFTATINISGYGCEQYQTTS